MIDHQQDLYRSPLRGEGMRRTLLLVPVIVIVLVVILLALNQENTAAPLPGNEVESSGGLIVAFDGAVKLEFPPGALSRKTTIVVSEVSTYPDAGKVIPGTVYEFGPNGTQFQKPVKLSIRYDPSQLPAGTKESNLRIVLAERPFRFTSWLTVANSTVDTGAKTVTASVSSFSTYGITGDDDLISDEYKEFMKNPTFDLSGTVVINPSPSVICEPGGELHVEAVYTDAQGHLIGYMQPPNPVYIWYLECETGSMQEAYITDETAGPYELMPSVGVIVLKAPADAEGKKGKLVVRVDDGGVIRAQAEIPVEFMSGARLEPNPADCPAGSMIQLYCQSPYNYIGALKEAVRFEWRTSGAFGVLLGEGGQTAVNSSARNVIYRANSDAPEGASDSVVVSVYVSGKLKSQAETTVLISGFGVYLEPYLDFWAYPGKRKSINCRFSGKAPQGEREYNWTCTSRYGSLWYPEEYTKKDYVWYLARNDAEDYGTDEVTLEVYLIQGSDRALLGRATTTLEIYNPQTVYNLCSDPTGEHFMRGSGMQWQFEIIGHGANSGGFKARPGDRLRLYCIRKGVGTGDIYLRVGMVGTGATDKTQLLLTADQIYDGLDATFEITIS